MEWFLTQVVQDNSNIDSKIGPILKNYNST